jgi:hypothetical protein
MENEMSKKTKSPKQSKAKSTKAGRDSAAAVLGDTIKAPLAKPGKRKAAKTTDGKLSCVDAAAKVLAEKKAPMTTKEMIEAMAAKKYWTSPGGKTPAATLYTAVTMLPYLAPEGPISKRAGGDPVCDSDILVFDLDDFD